MLVYQHTRFHTFISNEDGTENVPVVASELFTAHSNDPSKELNDCLELQILPFKVGDAEKPMP